MGDGDLGAKGPRPGLPIRPAGASAFGPVVKAAARGPVRRLGARSPLCSPSLTVMEWWRWLATTQSRSDATGLVCWISVSSPLGEATFQRRDVWRAIRWPAQRGGSGHSRPTLAMNRHTVQLLVCPAIAGIAIRPTV